MKICSSACGIGTLEDWNGRSVDGDSPSFLPIIHQHPLPSLKQYDEGKACLGWPRFELEVNGDVLGGFDFEVTARKADGQ